MRRRVPVRGWLQVRLGRLGAGILHLVDAVFFNFLAQGAAVDAEPIGGRADAVGAFERAADVFDFELLQRHVIAGFHRVQSVMPRSAGRFGGAEGLRSGSDRFIHFLPEAGVHGFKLRDRVLEAGRCSVGAQARVKMVRLWVTVGFSPALLRGNEVGK